MQSDDVDDAVLSSMWVRVPLFGGAMKITLPHGFKDVSKLREIPDNQEVFLDMNTDLSLIIELIEADYRVTNEFVCRYFFEELGQLTSALEMVVDRAQEEYSEPLARLKDVPYSCFLLSGRHIVLDRDSNPFVSINPPTSMDYNSRSVSSRAKDVAILLAVIRIPTVQTDVVVSLNYGKKDISAEAERYSFLKNILQSFSVLDWNLFV